MRSPHFPLLLAALAIGTGGALAQSPTPPPAKLDPPVPSAEFVSFAQLDRNQDGFVAKSEIPSGHELSGKFARLDEDGDGKLSPAEFDKYTNEKR